MSPELRVMGVLLVIAIVWAGHEDPRAWNWIKAHWQSSVGVWFARRRMVGSFTERRRGKLRVGEPDQHSPGIMVTRRDVTTGNWT